MTSNLNRWAPWYDDATEQRPYGDEVIYQHAVVWLAGTPVEDWGCGYAWYARYHIGPYRGVDGTRSPWCDIHADLTQYRSEGWNVLLRDVLEHNHEWRKILDNAVASFADRLFIAIFTPLQDETRVLAEDVGGLGVPDIGFRLADITDAFGDGLDWDVESVRAHSGYDDVETLIRVTRR